MRLSRGQSEFNAFVQERSDQLLRTGYLIVWDLGEAEDLVQECLMRIARRWSRVRRMDDPYRYARRTLVNLAFSGVGQRKRRNSELRAEPPEAAVPDDLELRGTRAELRLAIGILTERQRTILGLRYLEDLTETQVADLLGCSVGNVKSSAARALERLRLVLEAESEGQVAQMVAHTTKEKSHERPA